MRNTKEFLLPRVPGPFMTYVVGGEQCICREVEDRDQDLPVVGKEDCP